MNNREITPRTYRFKINGNLVSEIPYGHSAEIRRSGHTIFTKLTRTSDGKTSNASRGLNTRNDSVPVDSLLSFEADGYGVSLQDTRNKDTIKKDGKFILKYMNEVTELSATDYTAVPLSDGELLEICDETNCNYTLQLESIGPGFE